MKGLTSSLALANLALREGRREDAVFLYSSAREATPGLRTHIDFNLDYMGRELQGEEKSQIFVASAESPIPKERIPTRPVLVIVVAKSVLEAGETARLLSRRANTPIGILVLLQREESTQIEAVVGEVLGATQATYSLIVTTGKFPGTNWLENAYLGVVDGAAEAVYANTGLSMSPETDKRWMNLFALTSVLKNEVLGGGGSNEYTCKPDFLLVDVSGPAVTPAEMDPCEDSIHVFTAPELLRDDSVLFTRNVCVIMPCISLEAGRRTARLLSERSGLPADFVVAVDTGRQGFIRTLNQAARRSSAEYIVYLAEDAWPGVDWLQIAHERIRRENKSLLAFNCGKWHGRVAAFGMVKKSWAYSLYGQDVLYEGYQSHRADNELTVIARAQDNFVYAPECVLIENDADKVFRRSEREAGNFNREDARLFRQRFVDGFSGLADQNCLAQLHDEYLNVRAHYAAGRKVEIS